MSNKITVEVDLDVLEAIMQKYSRMAHSRNEPNMYFTGVADGINHSWKFIQGIYDDYMDGVEGIVKQNKQ